VRWIVGMDEGLLSRAEDTEVRSVFVRGEGSFRGTSDVLLDMFV